MFTRMSPYLLIVLCSQLTSSAFFEDACCTEEVCEHQSKQTPRFQTVQEVVDHIISVAPPQHLKTLGQQSRSEFLGMHFKLDEAFDQRLGLKDGNQALLDDAGAKGHRRAWRNIRIALWEKLQELE
jgi:hypothetical protein